MRTLSTRDRVIVFGVGFLIGCCVVTYILLKKQKGAVTYKEPATVAEIEAAVVPKIFQAYQERRVPMESKFIRLERIYPVDDDMYQRAIILKGERAGQLVRVVETVQRGHGEFADTVQAWRIMAANRVRVQLRLDKTSADLAREIKSSGYGVIARGAAANELIVSLPQSRPESVPAAIDFLVAITDLVESAQPDYLDETLVQPMETVPAESH